MEIEKILERCDHTLLKQTATAKDIEELCSDALKYKTASVCVPPCFVRLAKEFLRDRVAVCTVIGFPNGYNTTDVKVFETERAVADGADEIDMVINIGKAKENDFVYVEEEIRAVRKVCEGKVLKVITENCLLSDEEKERLCSTVWKGGADYIKTSTGFSTGGATFEDVALFKRYAPEGLKIKAAGGISTLADAEKFLELGAERLGTSRIVKIAKEKENAGK